MLHITVVTAQGKRKPRRKSQQAGPPEAWANWRASLAEVPAHGGAEFALYTDCRLTGDAAAFGPYSVINTVAWWPDELTGVRYFAIRRPRPVILRVRDHLRQPSSPMSETWLVNSAVDDEIAALLSLALGRRFHAGGLTREFDPDGDPAGQPFEFQHSPAYLPEGNQRTGWQLPEARTVTSLPDASRVLDQYVRLGGGEARALARAARSFGNAMWVAEADPQEAWLKLVAAVEAAAVTSASQNVDPLEALAEWRPDLAQLLAGVELDIRVRLAEELWPLVGSTKRFVDFLMRYLPPEPAHRPTVGRLDWENLRPAFRAIYARRSEALHEALPIPWGMWGAPRPDGDAWWEAMPGIATTHGGLEYSASEAPMFLHTFMYIVRGTLLNWWAQMAAGPEPR